MQEVACLIDTQVMVNLFLVNGVASSNEKKMAQKKCLLRTCHQLLLAFATNSKNTSRQLRENYRGNIDSFDYFFSLIKWNVTKYIPENNTLFMNR